VVTRSEKQPSSLIS